MRIRPYEPADLTGCLAVFDSNVPEFFVEAERPDFEAFLRALPGPYLVLEAEPGDVGAEGAGAAASAAAPRDSGAGSRIVGCGGWAIEAADGRADVCWGMVLRELHGKGLGRRLLEARLEGIRRDGAARYLALNTSQHTTGFYERLGFRITEVVADGFAPGLDRCEMRLDLRERVSGR